MIFTYESKNQMVGREYEARDGRTERQRDGSAFLFRLSVSPSLCPSVLKFMKAIASLILLLHCAGVPSMAQTVVQNGAQAVAQAGQSSQPGEIYAGIELTTEGARAIALRVSRSEEEPDLKLIYSENIPLALGRAGDGQFAPDAANQAALAVLALLARLRQQSQAPPEHVFLIGSSGLGADRPEGLVKAIGKMTGKSIKFLDAETEIQLSVVGVISRLWKVGDTQIDNRNSSALIEINGDRTLGGYQLLKYSPDTAPGYDFVTMSVPHRAGDAASFRQALRGEVESKPGLVSRKRVYLTGSIPWAVATLLHPEDRQTFVQLTNEDIEAFAEKVTREPRELFNQNLSYIRDRDLRREAKSELQAVKNAFTPERLVAGAEALRAVASEFELQGKQIWFPRFGYLRCLLSYIRLQAER